MRWELAVVVVAIAAIIGLGVFYLHEKLHFGSTSKMPAPNSLQKQSAGAAEGRVSSPLERGTPPAAKVQGSDYDVMRLVPGGEIALPGDFGPEGGKTVTVKPFYMTESPITNQQYVDFLNKVIPSIRVENSVVRSEAEIWLMLGEVTRGYEPIIFRDGRFDVKNASHSACPILRVTGYGALAYVKFHGLRLSTDKEWFFAVTEGKLAGANSAPTQSESAQGMMMGDMHGHTQTRQSPVQLPESSMPPATPVIMFKPNDFGIRQLNRNIGEWGVRITGAASGKSGSETEVVILGGPAGRETGTVLSAVRRNPLEAFEEVGFRCVRDAPRDAR